MSPNQGSDFAAGLAKGTEDEQLIACADARLDGAPPVH
jgi:hypothetical protein